MSTKMLRSALALALVLPASLDAQLMPQAVHTDAEFRAMDAPSADVVWAAGRGGVYVVTVDGGATWRADTVAGAEALFFTGAWAADSRTAYLLGTSFDGGLARIYRTDDGGATWTMQWESTEPGVFMDALQCFDVMRCISFGDPYDGRLVIIRTTDGATWSRVPADRMPDPIEGEAGFAASGTTLTLDGSARGWIGTGIGSPNRVYITDDAGESWTAANTPLPGNATSGIFGVAFRDSLRGVAAGGDYQRRTEEQQNVIVTSDGGLTWTMAGTSLPHGVRYGVAYSSDGTLVGVGPSGVGVSFDDGATWIALDSTAYNTVTFSPNGDAWVAGPDGRVARIRGEDLQHAGH